MIPTNLIIRRISLLVMSAVFCAVAVHAQSTQPLPPVAPVRPVVTDYFGVKITDPYRYMENLEDPQVAGWIKAQANYATDYFAHLPGRDDFMKEIVKYVDAAHERVFEISHPNADQYFYEKLLAGESLAKLYMRKGLDGPETLLVDTDQYKGPKGEPAAINYYTPSHDGKYLAFGISVGGAEIATLRIMDTETKKVLPETFDRTWGAEVNWLPGDQAFTFNRMQKLPPNADPNDLELNSRVYLHKLGTSPDDDVPVLGNGVGDMKIDPIDIPIVIITQTSDYMIGLLAHGTQIEQTLYVAPLKDLGQPGLHWTKVCSPEDLTTDFTVHGNDLYLVSHEDAPRFKVLRVDMTHPDLAHADVILPQGKPVFDGIATASDAMYFQVLDSGLRRVFRMPWGSKEPTEIKMPFEGNAELGYVSSKLPGAGIYLDGWTHSSQLYQYDPATNQVTNTKLMPLGPYDAPDNLTSVEVKATSYDGEEIPLSIVMKKGTVLDGSNPVIMDAYGAYGMVSDAFMSMRGLPWLNRGGILAYAHVRGGGEKGVEWYHAGYKLTKPNTWRDLIACAKYMIDQKYTSASKLAIIGGSAGGITIGRAITAQPDLFAAAWIEAGCVNALRQENSPNGAPNIPEFGSTTTEDGFEDLLAMDAYHHVEDGVAYPAVVLQIGMNDPRVAPWQSAKFAARLQAATSSKRPILLRVDYENGHGIGASRKQIEEETADEYAFFLAQFGIKP